MTGPLPRVDTWRETPDDTSTDPREWIRWELYCLWHDLTEARSNAIRQCVSIKCESLVHRIKVATQIVGPIHWKNVSIPDILSGRYLEHCELVGEPYSYPDPAELERVRARWQEIHAS